MYILSSGVCKSPKNCRLFLGLDVGKFTIIDATPSNVDDTVELLHFASNEVDHRACEQ